MDRTVTDASHRDLGLRRLTSFLVCLFNTPRTEVTTEFKVRMLINRCCVNHH